MTHYGGGLLLSLVVSPERCQQNRQQTALKKSARVIREFA